MDISFLNEIGSNSILGTITGLVGVIFVMIAIILIIFNIDNMNKDRVFIKCIVFIACGCASLLVASHVITSEETENTKERSEKLSQSIADKYNIEISNSDSVTIVEKHNDELDSKEQTKINVTDPDTSDLKVLYYTIEGSKLEFYKEDGDSFTRIDPQS